MDAETLRAVLLGLLSGGSFAGILGLVAAVRGWRTDKWSNEGTLVTRLNQDSREQGERADAEAARARRWEAQAGVYRRQLISAGVEPLDTEWLRNGVN